MGLGSGNTDAKWHDGWDETGEDPTRPDLTDPLYNAIIEDKGCFHCGPTREKPGGEGRGERRWGWGWDGGLQIEI